MYFLKYLFILTTLLPIIIAFPQFNLYFTDPLSNKQTDLLLQHNCLYVVAIIEKETNHQQILSFCLSQSSWNIQNTDINEVLTFAELAKQQITSQQLYLWSAPIDIIEDYQLFLTQQLPTSMATQLFYNCTLPRFGPKCQYEFDNYKFEYSSLNEMIKDYYFQHSYKPTTLTCYIQLQCYRGPSPTCLDWSEICDGKIDCLDNELDEKHCWKLEINQCEPNQYRCSNGQCIPFLFFRDDHHLPDCLDGSDEIQNDDQSQDYCTINIPAFACEDVTCTIYRSAQYFQYKTLLTSSCQTERNHLLSQALFSNQSKFLSEDCLFAFKCLIHMPIPQDPICRQFCQNKICDKIIENLCPDILFLPDVPVLFGHIYFAYTKNYSKYSDRTDSPPHYICFTNQFCDELINNKLFIIFNNTKCIRPQDLPLTFSVITGRSWINKYISTTSNLLFKCNSMINNNSILCNKPNMYRCINSSKCISIYRLSDGIFDCNNYDDENPIMFNDTLSSKVIETHFKCTKLNKYISYRLVKNDECNCNLIDDNSCEDENFDIYFIRNHISFQTICDGFIELNPMIIDGQNHTDETECEKWFCNNKYTNCDGIWNCFNGIDEINCDYSLSLLNCPSNHHICVSAQLPNELQCLSIEKANDGIIDCLGATDEPKFCRSHDQEQQMENFYCITNNLQSCISHQNLCDNINQCLNGDDEQFCDINRNFTIYGGICFEKYQSIRTDVETFLCQRFNDINKQRIIYFSLDTNRNSISQTTKQQQTIFSLHSDVMKSSSEYCHRGIELRVWLNKKENLSRLTCLCPSSYSGSQCQYQNHRISLTIQFRALSDSWKSPFVIVILLIDHSYQRIVYSYQQFIYLSIKDCQRKFHYYFIYSSNLSKNYSIHIDIYEQLSLNYRTSFLFPIQFSFLPIYRLSLQLTIPQHNKTLYTCSNDQCIHGKCIKYFNNNNQTFCQCEQGWSGQYCTIQHHCSCSFDSLCLGISSSTNRSICLCPRNKFGSRCLLTYSTCQSSNQNYSCFNNGQCLITDVDETLTCICPKGFSGNRCQIIDNKIILSFHNDIILSQSIFLHFIQIMNNSSPKRSTTFKTTSAYQTSFVIHWSHPFHLLFIELPHKLIYLVLRQQIDNQSTIITKTIQSSDRCQHINETFNQSFIQLHLLRRIKYYHLSCQNSSSSSSSVNLSCFYDDIHLCLCEDFGEQRQANCFEFDHQMKFNCLGENECENDAECFQDDPTCPKTSICVCPTCFYGRRCQFSTTGFSLFLDAILGYHIEPLISLIYQPFIVQLSVAFTIIITIAGLINGSLLTITFKNKKLHEVGSGIYLFASSIFTLLTIIMFALKFFILLVAQMQDIRNQSFLYFQCVSIDFFLRVSLHMNHWLNACVGCERAFTAIKATRFNKRKSKKAAKYVIFILLLMMIITCIHDPIHRRLINDDDDDDEYGENKRIWCIVSYPTHFQIFNTTVNIIHICAPFFINLLSTLIIIRSAARQRAAVQPQHTHRQHLQNQLEKYSRMLIAPFLLVILSLPHLIISFASGCMKSTANSWLFVIGYFVSFIPSIVTLFLFVFPSKLYKQELIKSIKKYKMDIQQLLASVR